MKAVILAGGYGTRISEETHLRPKPMIEIGGKPILWHIMKQYSHYGIDDFIICLGYKGYMIKEYFANYFLHMSDVTFDMKTNGMSVHQNSTEPWKVTLVDTGEGTMTGGRINRIRKYITEDQGDFCLTYGDGLSDINIQDSIDFHRQHGKFATVTAVQPPGRFGTLCMEGNRVSSFQEKPQGDGNWINGGFFVLSTSIFNFIHDDSEMWEQGPLESIARQGQLEAYRHKGFWQPMDTLRDRVKLEELWESNQAPWKVWES